MYIPKDKNKREQYLKLVERVVQLQREMDTLREDIKGEREAAVEMYGVSSKEFNAVVKVAYDKSKAEDQREDIDTAISNFEILTGEREEEVEEDNQE